MTMTRWRLGRYTAASMSERTVTLRDPFEPGSGRPPPHLAGRTNEKEVLAEASKRLQEGRPPAAEIVLVGPRGNGKTSLLREWTAEVESWEEEGEPPVDVLWLTPDDLETKADLYRRLIYADEDEAHSVRTTTGGIRAGLGQWFGIGGSVRRTIGREAPTAFLTEALLRRRNNGRALLVVVDEAHTLDPEIAKPLLNTSQKVRGAGLPFQLVLAGTPGLEATLGEADSSFWDRGEILGIGLLDRDAGTAALAVPLADAEVGIEPEVLDRAVSDSQGYPYFLQLWGASLVRSLARGERRLEARHGDTAAAAVAARRTTYYERRVEELKKAGLFDAAAAAAGAFARRDSLADTALERVLAGAFGVAPAMDPAPEVFKAFAKLERLGFFWKPPGRTDYLAGIPSLMRHVLERAPAAETSPDMET